ncbi:MAG: sulfite exporter TauE/SafE family protein [Rhodobacteraceae bacterium]|nr:sulfite exporter TauE/SafE family protein [Paracoccaceae bacterium]
MELLTTHLSILLVVYAIGVTLIAGVVKGAVGFAMPLIMISGISVVAPPEIAVASLILPIVMSNALQVLKAGTGKAWEAVKEFRIYIGIVCVMILISAQFLTLIPTQTMYLVLGIPVVTLSAIQLFGLRFVIPPERRNVFSLIAGIVSGTMGGMAGTWGPPTVLYLVAVQTPKVKQIAAQGVIYGLGSVMLLLGHLQSGVLNAQTAPLSAFLIIPGAIGMWIGFRIQDRIDQKTFVRVTLLVLLIAGLNLIRKGIVG